MSSLQEHIARHERAEGGIPAEVDAAPDEYSPSQQELIADARDWTAYCREARHGSPSSSDMIDDLADLIESQQQRIRELERENDHALASRTAWANDARSLRQQLAARDAVIAKVSEATDVRNGSKSERLLAIAMLVSAAPESVLAERDAAKWVDPKPWWYPVSQSRTAHKLAQTNAVCRPRTRAEYEADEHRNGATHE